MNSTKIEKIKVGIIGTGSISNEHIQAYLKNPNVELVAFCDINKTQLDKMAKKYEIKHVFTELNEFLKLKELDAVSVCTWNAAHAPCVIAALDAGLHVLCEKPMAISEQEAIKMKEAAERNKKLLMIGFVRRFGNDHDLLKEFIEQDYFGEIYYAKATYLRRNGNPGGWFGDKKRAGGGPLIDLGVHVIDLVRVLLGNPKAISVYGVTYQKLFNRPLIKQAKEYQSISAGSDNICDVEDMASALIRFQNGTTLSLETSFSLNQKKDKGEIELFGSKAGAKIDPELEMFSEINGHMTDVKLTTPTALNFNGLFAREIDHFVSCITEGIECKSPAGDGVEIMRILEAIYQSAETGHEVIL